MIESQETYLTRLVAEQEQNHERLVKLSAFLDKQEEVDVPMVSFKELKLLFLQQTLMTELDAVLLSRIALAEAKQQK